MKEKFINGLIEIISAIYLSNTFKEIIKVSQDILKKLAKITNSDTFDLANGILKSVSAITLSLLTITPVNAPDAPQMPDVPVDPGISLTDLSLADLLELVNEMNSQVDALIRSNTVSPMATSEGQEVEPSREEMIAHILDKFGMTRDEYYVFETGVLAEVYSGDLSDALAAATSIYNRITDVGSNNFLYYNLGDQPDFVDESGIPIFGPYKQYIARMQYSTYTDGTRERVVNEINSENYSGIYEEQRDIIASFLYYVDEDITKTPNYIDENGNAIHIGDKQTMHDFISFKAHSENRDNYVSPDEPWVSFSECGNHYHTVIGKRVPEQVIQNYYAYNLNNSVVYANDELTEGPSLN